MYVKTDMFVKAQDWWDLLTLMRPPTVLLITLNSTSLLPGIPQLQFSDCGSRDGGGRADDFGGISGGYGLRGRWGM